jgi:hypothetical protein
VDVFIIYFKIFKNCGKCFNFEFLSLSEKIISSKNEELYLNLPMLYFDLSYYIIWKINVKEILNKDCFIKFIIKSTVSFINC